MSLVHYHPRPCLLIRCLYSGLPLALPRVPLTSGPPLTSLGPRAGCQHGGSLLVGCLASSGLALPPSLFDGFGHDSASYPSIAVNNMSADLQEAIDRQKKKKVREEEEGGKAVPACMAWRLGFALTSLLPLDRDVLIGWLGHGVIARRARAAVVVGATGPRQVDVTPAV